MGSRTAGRGTPHRPAAHRGRSSGRPDTGWPTRGGGRGGTRRGRLRRRGCRVRPATRREHEHRRRCADARSRFGMILIPAPLDRCRSRSMVRCPAPPRGWHRSLTRPTGGSDTNAGSIPVSLLSRLPAEVAAASRSPARPQSATMSTSVQWKGVPRKPACIPSAKCLTGKIRAIQRIQRACCRRTG